MCSVILVQFCTREPAASGAMDTEEEPDRGQKMGMQRSLVAWGGGREGVGAGLRGEGQQEPAC